jgi:hypothetical protein
MMGERKMYDDDWFGDGNDDDFDYGEEYLDDDEMFGEDEEFDPRDYGIGRGRRTEEDMSERELWEQVDFYMGNLWSVFHDDCSGRVIAEAYKILKNNVGMNRERFKRMGGWGDEEAYEEGLRGYVADLRSRNDKIAEMIDEEEEQDERRAALLTGRGYDLVDIGEFLTRGEDDRRRYE